MYIECVQVCVNYSDFLAHTLPFTKTLFNRTLIVTTPADQETQRVCRYYNVECLTTDIFYEDGNKFNKGKGINAGLQVLSRRDWVVHMDSDIYLPPLTREYLERAQLDPKCVYGMDRMMCEGWRDWVKFIARPIPQHEQDVFVNITPFAVGSRIAKREYNGYIPIGFFQLWNAGACDVKYPVEHETAARSDMLFSLQWDRPHRQLIPEVVCIHLATEDYSTSEMGVNWEGRKTKKFGPPEKKLKPGWRERLRQKWGYTK